MKPMDIARFEKLKVSGNLPSPRGVALAIIRLSQKENAAMAELVRTVKPDPALVGRLVKAANSVNANPGRPVISVQEALVVLGMPTVRTLALGFSLLSQYKQGQCKGFDYGNFWSASLACAIAFKELALLIRVSQAEEAFSVGLLARIGELALATLFPEDYGGILRTLSKNPHADPVGLEIEALAMDHRELSAAMLGDWGLPRVFCEIVQAHEVCDTTPYSPDSREYSLIQSLALARAIARICVAPPLERLEGLARVFELGERLRIEKSILETLFDAVVSEHREWSSILQVAVTDIPGFAQLALQQAAQEAAGEHAASDAGVEGGGLERIRVLVAVGEDALRETICQAATQGGYDAIPCGHGEEALPVVLERMPHMLVTGHLARPFDALTLVRTLRETRLGRMLHILLLAPQGSEDETIQCYECGVDDYLASQPFSVRLLQARLAVGGRLVRLNQELKRDREELRRFAADLAISNRRFEEAALTDVLTGFPNRRYAMDRIQQEWAHSLRSGRPFACMVIDLDEFKQVNDRNGHDVGDAYLQQVATAIRSALRAEDVVCRTGGDEFLVICPEATELDAALFCAERIRQAVENRPVEHGELRLNASMSVGVAVRDADMSHPDMLIKRADEGVYLAKQQGRNRVVAAQHDPQGHSSSA